jgi:hypothetical protein
MTLHDQDAQDVKQPAPGTQCEAPWQQMHRQADHLERSLNTIKGYTDESRLVRHFLIAQIEALRWSANLYTVG